MTLKPQCSSQNPPKKALKPSAFDFGVGLVVVEFDDFDDASVVVLSHSAVGFSKRDARKRSTVVCTVLKHSPWKKNEIRISAMS